MYFRILKKNKTICQKSFGARVMSESKTATPPPTLLSAETYPINYSMFLQVHHSGDHTPSIRSGHNIIRKGT